MQFTYFEKLKYFFIIIVVLQTKNSSIFLQDFFFKYLR